MADPTKRTGPIETVKDKHGTPLRWPSGRPRYCGRVRWPDGSRPRRHVPEEHCYSEDRAREYLTSVQQGIDTRGDALLVEANTSPERPTVPGTTSDDWLASYVVVHTALGHGTAQHTGDWKRYVAPTLLGKPMADVTSEDIKAIRDGLTRLRLEEKISAQRALNIWSTVVKAPFSRAFTDDDPKYTSIRVGPDAANPAHDGIKPPVSRADCTEDEQERQAIEPHEASALLACERIPVERRGSASGIGRARRRRIACYATIVEERSIINGNADYLSSSKAHRGLGGRLASIRSAHRSSTVAVVADVVVGRVARPCRGRRVGRYAEPFEDGVRDGSSVMLWTSRSRPWHFGHCSTSVANVRRRSCDHGNRGDAA